MALTLVGQDQGLQQTARPHVVSPRPGENEADRRSQQVSLDSQARDLVQRHLNGLQARRESDLLREKLLLHIDGSSDFQWADIYEGSRIMIPRLLSPYRKTENVLRLLVDNAVAHHTTMRFRFFAESLSDRRAREKAIMDTVLMNDVSYRQDLNGLSAEALYLAMPAGFCPIHTYWRDDLTQDWYDPVASGPGSDVPIAPDGNPDMMAGPVPGMVDAWVGNPFGTVFDRAATRRSIRWCSYERLLPADAVRQAFPHVPGIEALEGSTKIPSASIYQRIARSWNMSGVGTHGTMLDTFRRSSNDDEMVSVVCWELAPGQDPRWPDGRLQMAAIPGEADTRKGSVSASRAIMLADQPLPARTFSFSMIYSHHRGNDVHGKPWVEDVDQQQVDLNMALSKRWEVINRMAEAPIVAPGGMIQEQMTDIGGYNLLEVDHSMSNWRPTVVEWPSSIIAALDREVEEKRRSMYTGGGYQAASRGEAPGSRMPYRAIVALQEADRTIHGPVNARFQRSMTDFAQRMWAQMKEFGDIGWIVNITGDEYEHLAEAYIDNTKLSDRPPRYEMVNAFGSNSEMLKQEILELVGLRGADGQPFLATAEARKVWPDKAIFDDAGDPGAVKRRRARTVARAIENGASQLRQQTGVQDTERTSQLVQQLGQVLFQQIEQQYERMRDDDLEANLAALSEITQDETADPVARIAAQMRQDLFYQWQASMAGMGMPQEGMGGPGGGEGGQGGEGPAVDRRGVAAEMQGGNPAEGHGGAAAS